MNPTEVTVSRTIPASPGKVFGVWMDPASPGSPWYGMPRLVIHLVVDGLFYFVVEHEGRTWAHYGRFLRIERPNPDSADSPGLAEYTWVSEATSGWESVEPIGDQLPRGTWRLPTGCTKELKCGDRKIPRPVGRMTWPIPS